ncbi:unnamed protein product [Heterobilharzia americana]|nr:unnamed protein product [Heterobilharzia americana]
MAQQAMQQKKPFVSLRYRTYSNDNAEMEENVALLEKVSIPQLDNECEIINNDMVNLRRFHHEMLSVYQQFTHGSSCESDEEKLNEALARLRIDLGNYNWKLERSFRYKMKISLFSDHTANKLGDVESFNRINELCSDLIKSSESLQSLILSYTKCLLKHKSYFVSAAQFRFTQPVCVQQDDCILEESIISHQIDRIRTYQTNVNNSRILLKEVEKINQRMKIIFKILLKSTAEFLIPSDF